MSGLVACLKDVAPSSPQLTIHASKCTGVYMLTLGSTEFEHLLMASKALREKREFRKAIALMESSISDMDKLCLKRVYMEIIDTADEAGELKICLAYAKKLEDIDPHSDSATGFPGSSD